MDTPSLVIVGAPHFFSSTTFRPFGPRVTFTASASWFMPRSRPRLASSLNAIILAAIGSSPPETMWLLYGSSRRPRRPALPVSVPSCTGEASSPRSRLGVVTLMPRVPTTLFSTLHPRVQADLPVRATRNPLSSGLSATGRKPGHRVSRRGRHADGVNHADQVETTVPHRDNQRMSATEKLAISLPKDLIEKLRRAKDEGRIDSVSGHIAELLRREDDWRDAPATLDRIL